MSRQATPVIHRRPIAWVGPAGKIAPQYSYDKSASEMVKEESVAIPWTPQEDAVILGWVASAGASCWHGCARKMPNRSTSEVRSRWESIGHIRQGSLKAGWARAQATTWLDQSYSGDRITDANPKPNPNPNPNPNSNPNPNPNSNPKFLSCLYYLTLSDPNRMLRFRSSHLKKGAHGCW